MPEIKHLRRIRSFVKREGRITTRQQTALATLWEDYGIDFSRQPLDLDQVFGRSAPRNLEIGFGKGEAIINMAEAHPEEDFLGIEVFQPGAGQVLALAKEKGLSNIRVLIKDAVEVLENQICDQSLERAYLFFPDPWHKRKHKKRRILNSSFTELLARKIKHQGHFFLATDWADYAHQMINVLDASPYFANTMSSGHYAIRNPRRPLTKYERRGHRLGHQVWDLDFVRIPHISGKLSSNLHQISSNPNKPSKPE